MSSTAFGRIRSFIRDQMRMSHLYQPVMLKTLVRAKGKASIREIARAFLMLDQSQLEYYERVTNEMPGKVLGKHGLVFRDGKEYRLTPELSDLSESEQREIEKLCDEAVEAYLEKRGRAVYDHRRQALGYVSGSIRYEVLKGAGGRCELCGVSHDVRSIEVDHIIPRKHGGSDDLMNFQALCWKCNANKGARDSTDFRLVREARDHRKQGCPFCEMPAARVVSENGLAYEIRDGFPVTPLHSLIIPRRHAETYFDLFEPERRAMNGLMEKARLTILAEDRTVSGFNIGINNGEAAGQTVGHAHVHLIPRRQGDVENPRGGIRGVIPGKASY